MQLKKALEDKKLDVRLRDRLLAEGKLTEKELEASFKKLKDSKNDFVKTKQEVGTESAS